MKVFSSPLAVALSVWWLFGCPACGDASAAGPAAASAARTFYKPEAVMVLSMDGSDEDGKPEPVPIHGKDIKDRGTHLGFTMNGDSDFKKLISCEAKSYDTTEEIPIEDNCLKIAMKYLDANGFKLPDWKVESGQSLNFDGHCWRAGGWSNACGNFTPFAFIVLKKGSDGKYRPYEPKKAFIEIDTDPEDEKTVRRLNKRVYVNVQPQL